MGIIENGADTVSPNTVDTVDRTIGLLISKHVDATVKKLPFRENKIYPIFSSSPVYRFKGLRRGFSVANSENQFLLINSRNNMIIIVR
jgi:hypothetical protein